MINKIFYGFVLSAVIGAGAAQAGGLAPSPVEPEIVVPTVVDRFAGGYVGANIGYAFAGEEDVALRYPTSSFDVGVASYTGGLFGIQAGYRHAFDEKTYGGVELRYAKTSIGDDFSTAIADVDVEVTSLLELRGSLARKINPTTLGYGFVGIASATADMLVTDNAGLNGVMEDERFSGFSAGFGAERALNDKWSIRGEYQFTRFKHEYVTTLQGVNVSKATPEFHTLNVALNYAF